MNNFVIESFNDEYPLVKYYTVRWDNIELSETDKFFSRFLEDTSLQKYREDFDEIVAIIKLMGNEQGALDRFFRFEEAAHALPPKGSVKIRQLMITDGENTLRLFCVKLRHNIVILFNGGIKTSQKVTDSPDLNMKFREAQTFAKRIDQAIKEGDILINEKKGLLYPPNNASEIFI